ncbi:MAG: bifunctional folylpolyglutamate synthase/dihydrofolate synthase [Prevotella sp.]|nr:bifunctional folylpolyglutamate synthase/dihydrofolate synthase [Staphylococcus sp.]MCM1349636.1 bifunctional folylpolyglutamate synthase/dihydrofolate synthase [Prevotella sp.]
MEPFVRLSDFIAWVQVQKRFSKKVNLDKMRYYCELLGHPEAKIKTIHVTGTNGKGSTVMMLASILMESGYHIGTFTSPYVTCFNERISFDGEPISDEELLHVANQIITWYPTIEKDGFEYPSFFEFLTLCAFVYFAGRVDLDFAIIEVGMGGKLDSTNVITPLVSVITNVALDHMQILGNTTAEILENKLGIVKTQVPIVCGISDCVLQEIAINRAKKSQSICIFPDYSSVQIHKCDLEGSLFSYKSYMQIELGLIGFHQIENALVVLEVMDILRASLGITEPMIRNGLQKHFEFGRLEKVLDNPKVYIDGGHNINGVARVTEFIQSLQLPYTRAIVAISHDKELAEMIHLIDQTFDEVIFTAYTYSRSASPEELFLLSHHPRKKIVASLEEALDLVKQHPVSITIFMGSLYLVSEIRKMVKDEKNK